MTETRVVSWCLTQQIKGMTLGSHCCATVTPVTQVASHRKAPQTDRRGRADRVFFPHARARRTSQSNFYLTTKGRVFCPPWKIEFFCVRNFMFKSTMWDAIKRKLFQVIIELYDSFCDKLPWYASQAHKTKPVVWRAAESVRETPVQGSKGMNMVW
jgi:hypothetical protein